MDNISIEYRVKIEVIELKFKNNSTPVTTHPLRHSEFISESPDNELCKTHGSC